MLPLVLSMTYTGDVTHNSHTARSLPRVSLQVDACASPSDAMTQTPWRRYHLRPRVAI